MYAHCRVSGGTFRRPWPNPLVRNCACSRTHKHFIYSDVAGCVPAHHTHVDPVGGVSRGEENRLTRKKEVLAVGIKEKLRARIK